MLGLPCVASLTSYARFSLIKSFRISLLFGRSSLSNFLEFLDSTLVLVNTSGHNLHLRLEPAKASS